LKRIVAILLLMLIIVSIAFFPPVFPASQQSITINSDGSINPSSAPINRNGDIYTLSSDISTPIDVKLNNIILDGADHRLTGTGSNVALKLECMNVSVQNFRLTKWACGVLGVYDNNTVKNCVISQCSDYAVKVYAQYYQIIGNDMESNVGAVLIGPGGLNYVAGNRIINNKNGFCFYDSANLVVQNIIENCTERAVVLIAQGWNQMIYGNNFVNNKMELDDGTLSERGRPSQNQILPWDNGVTGNYWSDYTGAGIGDTPKIIYTNYDAIAPDSSFFDRYPLNQPVNINLLIPPVPYYMTKQAAAAPNLGSQAKAVSFFRDVIGLDMEKYTPVLECFYYQTSIAPDKMSTPIANKPTEYLEYGLQSSVQGYVEARVRIIDGEVVYCDLFCFGKILFANISLNNYLEKTRSIIRNYYVWSGDSEVGQMAQNVGDIGSSIEISSNLRFVGRNGNQTRFSDSYNQWTYGWYHNVNGADYTGVEVFFEEGRENIHKITFSDNRALYQVVDTSINISETQATDIAEKYVEKYFYLSYGNNSGTTVVSGLGIGKNSTATLTSIARDSQTLYPCWVVQVPLDKTYPDYTNTVTVRVWADSGRIMDALRQVTYPQISGEFSSVISQFYRSVLLPFFAALILIGSVLVIVGLWKKNKDRQI
jgi:hypothetical protein